MTNNKAETTKLKEVEVDERKNKNLRRIIYVGIIFLSARILGIITTIIENGVHEIIQVTIFEGLGGGIFVFLIGLIIFSISYSGKKKGRTKRTIGALIISIVGMIVAVFMKTT